jgi:Sec-independent protein translocase protein TatA
MAFGLPPGSELVFILLIVLIVFGPTNFGPGGKWPRGPRF